MKVYDYRCAECGYSSKHVIGTPDMDQALSDVNNDFAIYRLFICPTESKFVTADFISPNFEQRCPADGSKLVEVKDVENPSCPRCGKRLSVSESKPLSVASEQSAE